MKSLCEEVILKKTNLFLADAFYEAIEDCLQHSIIWNKIHMYITVFMILGLRHKISEMLNLVKYHNVSIWYIELTHLPPVPHICMIESVQHWFR